MPTHERDDVPDDAIAYLGRTARTAAVAKWVAVSFVVISAAASAWLFVRAAHASDEASKADALASSAIAELADANDKVDLEQRFLTETDDLVTLARRSFVNNADVLAYEATLGGGHPMRDYFDDQLAQAIDAQNRLKENLADAKSKFDTANLTAQLCALEAVVARDEARSARGRAVLVSEVAGGADVATIALAFALSMSAAKARAMVALAARPTLQAPRRRTPKDSS
jgi:hypothetical protein